MCGFVGVASSEPQTSTTWLAQGRDAMTHRGPDGAGEWWSPDRRVGLAHRRLSILDLSATGHQPMHLTERGLSIVFNGEIYNFGDLRRDLEQHGHHFQSHSDTEVLLAAFAEWGTDCLSRLNGMFAFAIYDAKNERIFIARDRAGEKPLFYRHLGGSLYFGSELKALLANPELPRKMDTQSLDCYLAMGFVPGDNCILQGYRKLPPAHAMEFNVRNGSIRTWRYWELPEIDNRTPVASHDETALLDELETLLEDAVERQMVADVPVGILLSGGVDSSLITAMAVRRANNVRTFSIGFSGHGRFDETQHARLIANHFGTKHTELMAEPTTAELLPVLVQQFDEPMVDSSMFPTYLVSHLVRQHCTVALGGDGGDELFGGYPKYQRLMSLAKCSSHAPKFLRHGIAFTARQLMPAGTRGRNFLLSLSYDLGREIPHFQELFDRTFRGKLLPQLGDSLGMAEQVRANRFTKSTDLLFRATRYDFENYLPDDILVKVDRASMLHSLELRAPLLDYRVIEFAFGKVPSHLKATSRERKIFLKRLAARVLPTEFDKQRKQGFSIPMSEWLKAGPFRELFWDTLSSVDMLIDSAAARKLLDGQDRGENNGERLFALVQLELWRTAYGVSV